MTPIDRAVLLSLLPEMTLPRAARAAGVPLAALRRARKTSAVRVTRDDLLVAALTRNGEETEGPIPDLAGLASWLDHVNHDGSTAEGVRQDLERLAAAGRLVLTGGRYRLVGRWP